MEDIRLYDFEFRLLHVEPNVISVNWNVKYNGIGTFQGKFSSFGALANVLAKNRFVVLTQGDKQAIVTGKTMRGDDLTVYGRTVNWILSRRTVPKFGHVKGNVEDIARGIVLDGFSDLKAHYEGAFCDVPEFQLGDVAGIQKEVTFWRNSTNLVSDVVQDLLDRDGAGHRVLFDPSGKRWVFEVIKGREIPLRLTQHERNVYDLEYNEDLQDYCTEGWYHVMVAETEDAPEQTEVSRFLQQEEKSGIYRWVGVLSGDCESEALANLKKRGVPDGIAAKTRGILFGKDYQLGDVVRVEAFGFERKNRISEVSIWSEHNNHGEQPVLSEITEEEESGI